MAHETLCLPDQGGVSVRPLNLCGRLNLHEPLGRGELPLQVCSPLSLDDAGTADPRPQGIDGPLRRRSGFPPLPLDDGGGPVLPGQLHQTRRHKGQERDHSDLVRAIRVEIRGGQHPGQAPDLSHALMHHRKVRLHLTDLSLRPRYGPRPLLV